MITTHTSPATRSPRPRHWHRRIDGLHVVKVSGSDYEMGRQHGEMLADDVRRGPIPFYRTYLQRMMGNSWLGPITPVLWPVGQKLIGSRVAQGFPKYATDAIRGLADGSGIPYAELLEGCTLPDAALWVASKFMRLRDVGPAVYHRTALGLGCTSAIAWGDATADGKLLHARNLDYHGVDCWPSTAAVVFHEPDDGMRYVAVTAAGVLMGGHTAMNEAGLTLTVHQHMFTDRTQLGGTPIGCVGDLIMRRAETLEDAEKLLREHTPIGCWTYLIADAKTRRVLVWEESPERGVVIKKDGEGSTFGYANIYLDRELGDTEQNLYGSYWRHNLARHQRVNQLLDHRPRPLTPNDMAAIIADRGQNGCCISEAIGMVMTVASVVFQPEDGRLWVGAGPTPTSHRRFLPLSLSDEAFLPDVDALTGGIPGDEDLALAHAAYREAYIAYVDRGDLEGARKDMERAAALAPEQPLFHCLVGLVTLKLGDAPRAMAAFSRALELGHHHPERVAAFNLWRGRAADLQGRRDDALRHYRHALGHHADRPVHAAARRGLRKPYDARRAGSFDIDFTFADVVNP